MIDTDDLEPVRPVLKPLDLQQMSIGELEDYIRALDSEITRTESMIEKKKSHRSGIEGLFGKG
jgi:uncharacterized small protein (DUF1192 family)